MQDVRAFLRLRILLRPSPGMVAYFQRRRRHHQHTDRALHGDLLLACVWRGLSVHTHNRRATCAIPAARLFAGMLGVASCRGGAIVLAASPSAALCSDDKASGGRWYPPAGADEGESRGAAASLETVAGRRRSAHLLRLRRVFPLKPPSCSRMAEGRYAVLMMRTEKVHACQLPVCPDDGVWVADLIIHCLRTAP